MRLSAFGECHKQRTAMHCHRLAVLMRIRWRCGCRLSACRQCLSEIVCSLCDSLQVCNGDIPLHIKPAWLAPLPSFHRNEHLCGVIRDNAGGWCKDRDNPQGVATIHQFVSNGDGLLFHRYASLTALQLGHFQPLLYSRLQMPQQEHLLSLNSWRATS